MSRSARLILFGVAGPGLAAILILGFRGLPDFGDYHGVYGHVIDGIGVTVRHGTDLITADERTLRGLRGDLEHPRSATDSPDARGVARPRRGLYPTPAMACRNRDRSCEDHPAHERLILQKASCEAGIGPPFGPFIFARVFF